MSGIPCTPLRLAQLSLALTISACTTVGPNYTPPRLPAMIGTARGTGFEASSSPAVSSAPLPGQWWRLYQDPTLDGLVAEALTANTDLRAAAANLERARAQVQEVRAAAGLQTALGGGETFAQTSTLGIAPAGGAHASTDLGIGISYEVDVVGRIRRAVEAQTASAEAQAAALDLARVTVAAGVVSAYTSACAAGSQLVVAERSLKLQRDSTALTARGTKAGLFPQIDLVRAQALIAQLEAALPPLERDRRVALYLLATLLGRAPTDFPAELERCATLPSIGRPLPIGDGAALIRRRPDVRQAERSLASATASIGVETAALYPSISLGASFGTTSRTVGGLLSDSALRFGFGPLISWTVPNRSVARARIAEANATARGALANFDGVVLTALRETQTALTRYVRDIDENTALRTAREQTRRGADLQARARLRGTISGLDLIDAQRSLASAQSALAASDAQLAADRTAVFLALGGGWEGAPEPVTP